MAITIITSWGGKTDNSYSTLSTATGIIHNQFLNTEAWDNATSNDKSKALIVATRQIEGLRWSGSKYFYDQALQFPRTPPGVEHPIGILGSVSSAAWQTLLESDLFQARMKTRVQNAVASQALNVLQDRTESPRGRSRHRDLQRKGVTSWSRSMTGISESYQYKKHEVLCPEAWQELHYYKGQIKLARGDSQTFTPE